jgi:hypothetical protein
MWLIVGLGLLQSGQINYSHHYHDDDVRLPHSMTYLPQDGTISHHYEPKLVPVPSLNLKLYSAYYENRKKFKGPSVCVLGRGAVKKIKKIDVYALVKFTTNSTPECLGPSHCSALNEASGFLYHTVKYCFKLSNSNHVLSVALTVDKNCSSLSPPVEVYKDYMKPKRLGLCLQTPIYKATNQSLIQYIEMYRLLGVEVFTMYTRIPKDTYSSVIDDYVTDGILEFIQWPKEIKIWSNYQHYVGQMLAFNDCLYRNVHRVEYLVVADLDEILVPRSSNTLTELIDSFKKPKTEIFYFLNTFYTHNGTTNTSKPFYFDKLYRPACVYRVYHRSKYIVKPAAVDRINIHWALQINNRRRFVVPQLMGTLNHYRKKVSKDCKNRRLTYDPVMLRYEKFLNEAFNRRLHRNSTNSLKSSHFINK